MKSMVKIILLGILFQSAILTYGQIKVLPIDLQIGYGFIRKPFLELGIYLDKAQRHRIGLGASYRIPINFKGNFSPSDKSFHPLFFMSTPAYDGPGASLQYSKLLNNNLIQLIAKMEYAYLNSSSYWKNTNMCSDCRKANMYNASFGIGVPVDRRGIFSVVGELGYAYMHGFSTKRVQDDLSSPLTYERSKFYNHGLWLQLSLQVKIIGFNSGVAQNR